MQSYECCRCKAPKPLAEFYFVSAYGRRPRRNSGICRLCWNAYIRARHHAMTPAKRKYRLQQLKEYRDRIKQTQD